MNPCPSISPQYAGAVGGQCELARGHVALHRLTFAHGATVEWSNEEALGSAAASNYRRLVVDLEAIHRPPAPREIRITTRSGRCVNVLDLKHEDVRLDDIALGLSRQARYLGQTVRFYSVAEHSILVRDLLAYKYPDSSPLERRLALLHDAGEAYTGDIVQPYKEAFPQLARLAKDVQDVVERALGLENAGPWAPIRVAECDAWARNIEACLLFEERPPWAEDIGCPRNVWPPHGYDPHDAVNLFHLALVGEG